MKKIYKKVRDNWKVVFFTLSITIFIFITRLLLKEQIETFDSFVYKYITYYKNDYLTVFFKFISFLCSTYYILVVTILIMIFIKSKKKASCIGINVLICFLLNQTFKLIFARERPVDVNLIVESGYSFPSGHSMVSLAFYGFIVYLIYQLNISKRKKRICAIFFSTIILLIGISRIYLGVHYASDVIAGFALSMAYLVLFIHFVYNKIK